MITQTIEMTQLDSTESYQLIKDEHLASVIISAQILSGSRIVLSTYHQVVFSECTFYACEFQGVTFENCVFQNCNFEFSHIRNCKFKNCNFENCTWKATSTTISVYSNCDLDSTLHTLTLRNGNDVHFPERHMTTDIYIENLLAA